MNVKEFYEQIHGDYQEILSRLVTDDRIKRFLIKFLETGDMVSLREAWEKQDFEQIFTYAHRLKGIALNLSLNNLAKYTSDLTEAFRGGSKGESEIETELYRRCCEEYSLIEESIKKID